jgi:hypothetical protein
MTRALRILATILAGPCILVGLIWILQGVNVLPGSFMTGHIQWAVFGVILAAVGIALTYWVTRPRP